MSRIDDLIERKLREAIAVDQSRFDALPEAERELLCERFREKWRTGTVEKTTKAVETMDIEYLEKILWRMNLVSVEVFCELTGVSPVPKTDKAIREQLRRWYGPGEFDAYLQAKREKQESECRARELKLKESERLAALNSRLRWRVSGETKEGTFADYIRDLKSRGFVPVEVNCGIQKGIRLQIDHGDHIQSVPVIRGKIQKEFISQVYSA